MVCGMVFFKFRIPIFRKPKHYETKRKLEEKRLAVEKALEACGFSAAPGTFSQPPLVNLP